LASQSVITPSAPDAASAVAILTEASIPDPESFLSGGTCIASQDELELVTGNWYFASYLHSGERICLNLKEVSFQGGADTDEVNVLSV
jgi:hypothetical protein